MRQLIDGITRISLRFKWLTVAATIFLVAMGVYSYTTLNQELIPDIEFPQAFILSQNEGANSDNMLHMYAIPLEEGAQTVDGVVNVESTSQNGLSFVTVRNEFGLEQSRIVDDLQRQIDSIALPVRRLQPPEGMSGRDLIADLEPEQVAWLYAYAEDEDIGFGEQLDRDVWRALSDEALSGFPEAVFVNLESDVREALLNRRRGETVVVSLEPPALPDSWTQVDPRFRTVQDVAELTSNRNLAVVFNDLYEDGYVVGPLVQAEDLTADDVALFVTIEERCRRFREANRTPAPADGEDVCSFISYLNADVILAIPNEWLPADFLNQLSTQDRNQLGEVLLARELTGQVIERDRSVELPDAWQSDAPQLLTFGASDFPLGLVTVSSAVLSDEELRDYVENDLVPRLKDLGNVADVRVTGGETVPAYVLNPELVAVGLDPVTDNNGVVVPDDGAQGNLGTDGQPSAIPQLSDSWVGLAQQMQIVERFGLEELDSADDLSIELINALAEDQDASVLVTMLPAEVLFWLGQADPTAWEEISGATMLALSPPVAARVPVDDVCPLQRFEETDLTPPTLSTNWQALADAFGLEGVELSNAADLADLSLATCKSPSMLLNLLASSEQSEPIVASLSVDVLEYLAAIEPTFYQSLAPATVSVLSWDTVAALPDEVRAIYNPRLGPSWAQLSTQIEMRQAGVQLFRVQDLIDYEGDAAATLTGIVDVLQAGSYQSLGDFCGLSRQDFCGFAVLLVNDLSPEAIEALVAKEPGFLRSLVESEAGRHVLTYFSPMVLNSPSVNDFIDDLEDDDLRQTLTDIRTGELESAAESLQTEQNDMPESDPNAPALPSSWGPVGSFIGAQLQQADDILNIEYQANYESGADLVNSLAADPQGQARVRDLPLEVWLYLGENDQNFWAELSAVTLRLINQDFVSSLPDEIQERIRSGGERFEPEAVVTRSDGNPSLVITIFKEGDANTVEAWHDADEVLSDVRDRDDVELAIAFEQASFIEESLSGVQREGATGAIMAIIVILIFMNLSIRSTLVTSVSIPTSVLTAFFLMQFIPGNVYDLLKPVLDEVGRDSALGSLLEVILRLFPDSYTLNIMTLSGLTVAIGRVVDDSIVVLENIYRNIQSGEEQEIAIIRGTREVALAIFAATMTTIVVFLPLGLFGGVIGAFFLPFGLAVTYSLIGSYIAAITIVPVMAKFLISKDTIPEEGLIDITDNMSGYERGFNRFKNVFINSIDRLSDAYGVAIKWVLRNRVITLVIAFVSLVIGVWLLGQRPQQFLPDIGDPTIAVAIDLPAETDDGRPVTIAYTEARVRQLEAYLRDQSGVETVLTSVGGDPQQSDFFGSESVAETEATIDVGMESQVALDEFLPLLRTEAEAIFGMDYVQVSGASLADSGFGGFALELSGPEGITLQELARFDAVVLETLNEIEGLVNVESSLVGSGDDTTYIRIDGIPAIRYTAELESDDSLGLTAEAIAEVEEAVEDYRRENSGLSADVTVSQGFESEQQTEGFQQIFVSMGIATLIVYLLLAATFGHVVHPITILVSLPLSVVGAAVALTITDRALGLSAMIGLLMLIGIVVTNAVVLIDRVQQNRREKEMNTYDALVDAGIVRLRPILMTATATMVGLIPVSLGFTEGAIIAAELGTVVIGGLISSTFLTLLVVPVVYSLFDTLIHRVLALFGRGSLVA